jgi:acyl dehydratase
MPILPGEILDIVEIPVERGKIREFARSTFVTDAVHTDATAAEAAGFAAVPATATHSVVTGHYRDQRAFVETLGLALDRIVVGQVSWEYGRPLLAGDRLTATRTVEIDESREGRSGRMRIVTLRTEFVDQAGDVALVQREVLIERGSRA